MLHDQLAWYVAGPALGLCVIAVRMLFNGRLGVTGGFSEIIGQLSRRSVSFDWRGWFAIGLIVGGVAFGVLWGGPDFHGYGWLTTTFTGASSVWIAPILAGAGLLIGFGAKLAGGCTSGNGLSAVSHLSPAGLVATATFFAAAMAVTFVIKAVI